MANLRSLLTTLATGVLGMLVSIPPAHAVTIDWVTVGNPNNAADTTGYGSVASTFQIMKYEWTNDQYAAFLNAIDPEGTNPQGVWNESMGSSNQGGISQTLENSLGSRYVVKSDFANKPVTFVTAFSIARVANWLQNGSPVSPTTTDASDTAPQNTGVYAIGAATSGTLPAKSAGATYWIPLENEWYKAAYYNPTLNSGTGGYTLYGNGFSVTPDTVTADASGVGSAGAIGNFANYASAANWNGTGSAGAPTSVGTNGGDSYYGAFDMSGNASEFNTLSGIASSNVGIRGGSFAGSLPEVLDAISSSLRTEVGSGFVDNEPGFRIASVPEPGALALLATGGAAIAGALVRRRRVPSKI